MVLPPGRCEAEASGGRFAGDTKAVASCFANTASDAAPPSILASLSEEAAHPLSQIAAAAIMIALNIPKISPSPKNKG